MTPEVLSLVGGLAGVIIGSLLSLVTSMLSDRIRLRRDRTTDLLKVRREALLKAIGWLDIIEPACRKAHALLERAQSAELSEKAIMAEWPNIRHDMLVNALPPLDRAFLPSSVNSQLWSLLLCLDRFRPEVAFTAAKASRLGHRIELSDSRTTASNPPPAIARNNELVEALADFRRTLRREFESSYL